MAQPRGQPTQEGGYSGYNGTGGGGGGTAIARYIQLQFRYTFQHLMAYAHNNSNTVLDINIDKENTVNDPGHLLKLQYDQNEA